MNLPFPRSAYYAAKLALMRRATTEAANPCTLTGAKRKRSVLSAPRPITLAHVRFLDGPDPDDADD